MTDNRFIEEDWERLSDLDKMYLRERENEIWEEYQQWIDEQERQPAKIVVNMPKEVEK
jgi:hypothetical protein